MAVVQFGNYDINVTGNPELDLAKFAEMMPDQDVESFKQAYFASIPEASQTPSPGTPVEPSFEDRFKMSFGNKAGTQEYLEKGGMDKNFEDPSLLGAVARSANPLMGLATSDPKADVEAIKDIPMDVSGIPALALEAGIPAAGAAAGAIAGPLGMMAGSGISGAMAEKLKQYIGEKLGTYKTNDNFITPEMLETGVIDAGLAGLTAAPSAIKKGYVGTKNLIKKGASKAADWATSKNIPQGVFARSSGLTKVKEFNEVPLKDKMELLGKYLKSKIPMGKDYASTVETGFENARSVLDKAENEAPDVALEQIRELASRHTPKASGDLSVSDVSGGISEFEKGLQDLVNNSGKATDLSDILPKGYKVPVKNISMEKRSRAIPRVFSGKTDPDTTTKAADTSLSNLYREVENLASGGKIGAANESYHEFDLLKDGLDALGNKNLKDPLMSINLTPRASVTLSPIEDKLSSFGRQASEKIYNYKPKFDDMPKIKGASPETISAIMALKSMLSQ